MNKSDSIAELSAALAKAQGAMTAAKMDSTNPFLKNKYADLGSVIQAARAPLASNGLSFTQHPSVSEIGVTITTLLMHASGEWIESEITLPLDGGKGLSLAQSMGAIITYLRRYTLAAVLGIYADEDTDGNKPAKQAEKQPAQTAPEPTNGNGHTPVDELMPIEMAKTAKSSDGKLYDEIDSDTLAHMLTSITTKIGKGGYKPEELETYTFKRGAILAILMSRKQTA